MSDTQATGRMVTMREIREALGHDVNNSPTPERQTPDADDTLPAWLARRFDPRGPDWDELSDDDRSHWEHEARAVRRAVARNGFKQESSE